MKFSSNNSVGEGGVDGKVFTHEFDNDLEIAKREHEKNYVSEEAIISTSGKWEVCEVSIRKNERDNSTTRCLAYIYIGIGSIVTKV